MVEGLLFCAYIFDYLNVYLEIQMARSPDTIESARDGLSLFRYFISEKGMSLRTLEFCNVTPDLIRGFLSWLEKRGNARSTCNNRLTCIKSYLNYAAMKDVSIEPIAARISKIKPFKTDKIERPLLSDTQMTAILAQFPKTAKGARNKVLIFLLAETAVRVSEIVNIKISDLHLDRKNPYITIWGKGNKERHVPITETTADVIKKYITTFSDRIGEFLFCTRHAGALTKISTRQVQDFIKEYSDKAREVDPSIPDSVHPHMFRRTAATNAYQNGMPIEMVSSLLGHCHVETTRIYAKPSMAQMREYLNNVIPEEAVNAEREWEGKEDVFAKKLGLR